MVPASHSGSPSQALLSREDLDHVLTVAPVRWEDLRRRRILLTGGTGFVGTWLLASFVWADRHFGLGARAIVLSRSPQSFAARFPELAMDPSVELLQGDVRSFDAPGPIDFVVHAASQEPADQSAADLLARHDADLAGTRRLLEIARRAGASRLLFTSSGAVYGVQPPELALVDEDYGGAPDALDPRAAYGRAKRASESLCVSAAADSGMCCSIARCFAFLGPLLPLDKGYAAGDFLADALRGGPVEVEGDGTPYRSYLHAADLAAWLWTILLRGESCRPYNVGSDQALTIGELAERVAHLADPAVAVRVRDRVSEPAHAPARYVPFIDRARTELGLEVFIDLDDALERTWAWLQHDGRHEWAR